MSHIYIDDYDLKVATEAIAKIRDVSYDETTYEDLNDQLKFLLYLVENDKYNLDDDEMHDIMKGIIETYGRIFRSEFFQDDFCDKFCKTFNMIIENVIISKNDFQFAINHILTERFEKEIDCSKFLLFNDVLFKYPLEFTKDEAKNILGTNFNFTPEQINILKSHLSSLNNDTEQIEQNVQIEQIEQNVQTEQTEQIEQNVQNVQIEQIIQVNEISKQKLLKNEPETTQIDKMEKNKVEIFRLLCENHTLLTGYNIIQYIDKHNITPNFDMLICIQKWIITAQFIGDLIKRNLEYDIRTVEYLFNDVTVSMSEIKNIHNYVDKSINTVELNDNTFNFIFKNSKLIKNILFMLNKCSERNITFKIDKIKNVLNKTNVTNYNNNKEYKFESIHCADPLDEYLQIITYILECTELQDPYKLSDFLEYVCILKDELVFDMLIDRTIPTKQCLLNACISKSIYIVEAIIKIKPEYVDKECFKYLSNNNHTNNQLICTMLSNHSTGITYDIIEYMLNVGSALYNLEKYGISYDIELYDLCHRVDEFPFQYMIEFRKNSDLEMELREMIKNYKGNDEEVISYIAECKITPDYMMYDDAIRHNKEQIVSYLETNFNFKPNVKTLIRIENFKDRLAYYKRIQENEPL